MKTTRWIVLALVGLGVAGCCKKSEPESTGSAPAVTTAAATTTAAAATKFAGAYSSNWGTTTFEQNGSSVTAKYPRGTLSCLAVGDHLTCDWFEGNMRGKASLTKNADGTITGTWGNGSSATDGGPWRFSPKS